jgi:hypothetical protein
MYQARRERSDDGVAATKLIAIMSEAGVQESQRGYWEDIAKYLRGRRTITKQEMEHRISRISPTDEIATRLRALVGLEPR